MLPLLEKYEEIYGCYPKSPYAGGFRGSFVVSLSLPTQGGLEGLGPLPLHPLIQLEEYLGRILGEERTVTLHPIEMMP